MLLQDLYRTRYGGFIKGAMCKIVDSHSQVIEYWHFGLAAGPTYQQKAFDILHIAPFKKEIYQDSEIHSY